MGANTLRALEENLEGSFRRVAQDVHNLKKARKMHASTLHDMTLRQVKLEKDKASSKAVHTLHLAVDKIAHDQKMVKTVHDDVNTLKKDAVLKKDFDSATKDVEKQLKKLQADVAALKTKKDVINPYRIHEIEKNMLHLADIKDVVLGDVQKKYLNAKEVSLEMGALKQEFYDLYDRMSKLRRDVMHFPRTQLLANTFLLLALLSLAGAAVGVWQGFSTAANFLAVEAIAFILVGLILKAFIQLKK